MARILVLQHDDMGVGRLGATLRDHAFKMDIRRVAGIENPDTMPADLDGIHGLVILGSPQSVNDDDPWIVQEQTLIREAQDKNLPMVGVCFGHQQIAAALGGKVEAMEQAEWGLTRVSLGVPGQTESMLAGVPWDTMQFQSHSDEVVEAPSGASVLASSERCKNQIMRVGQRTFSFQFHFEVDFPTIQRFAKEAADVLERSGVDEAAAIEAARAGYARFATVADRLCVNMATYLFPFHALTSA